MAVWTSYPVTNGYITSYQGPGTDTPHYALDIATPFHTPLTALKSGTVVQEDYAAWGGELFIKPDDGSTEYYYYHPDQIEVVTGQHVTAGQEVALSGGENPGFPGALHPAQAQYSSGPHTHVGYFTGWVNSPDHGTIPYGPDPSSLISQTSVGINSTTNSTSNPPGGSIPFDQAGSLITGGVQDAALRIAVFLLLLLLAAGGLYLIFRDQINSGVKQGVHAAFEVAKVGVMA